VRVSGVDSVPGRPLVLTDVVALEATGAVHRRVPPADMTERGDEPTDPAHPALPPLVRPDVENVEHRPHASPVVELLDHDRGDLGPLLRVPHRCGMAAIGDRGGQFARMGELQQGGQLAARHVGACRHYSSPHISSIYSHGFYYASVRSTLGPWAR
jgi:hypothetical protein